MSRNSDLSKLLEQMTVIEQGLERSKKDFLDTDSWGEPLC
jgi:hypothetical protein